MMTIDRRTLIQGLCASVVPCAAANSAERAGEPQKFDLKGENALREEFEQMLCEAKACLTQFEVLANKLRSVEIEQIPDGDCRSLVGGFLCELNCKIAPLKSEVDEACETIGSALGQWRDARRGELHAEPYQSLLAEARRHRIAVAKIQSDWRKEQRAMARMPSRTVVQSA
jgi:hypothetical protein